jgi:hypothetical protein
MWNRVEVALQVCIYHPAIARFYMLVHFAQRIFAAKPRPEAVALRLELMLKDWPDSSFRAA